MADFLVGAATAVTFFLVLFVSVLVVLEANALWNRRAK